MGQRSTVDLTHRTGASELVGAASQDQPTPVRTCVVCRKRDSRHSLQRLVIVAAENAAHNQAESTVGNAGTVKAAIPADNSQEQLLKPTGDGSTWTEEQLMVGVFLGNAFNECAIVWDIKKCRRGRGIWVHSACLPRLTLRRLQLALGRRGVR